MVQQVYIPEKRNALEKIMQGLQVAQSVMGIKSQYDQLKINDYKLKQIAEDEAATKRREAGEFTEDEVSNLYRVPAGTKGAAVGYVQAVDRTPEGKAIYDEETGKPRTKLQQFYYIGKDPALIQSYLDKQSQYAVKIDENNIRARGGIPKVDIESGRVKNWSLSPKEGTIQSFYYDPSTQQDIPIWISPETARAVKTGEGDGQAKAPKWAEKSTELLSGWSAARRSGIDDPTEQQALEFSPLFVNDKITTYSKDIKEDDINFMAALERFDKEIGIDYSIDNGNIVKTKSKNITGVTDYKSAVPSTGVMGYFGRTLTDKNAIRNQSTVAGVVNLLLQKRSGAAISESEAARLASELNVAAGNNDPEGVRKVMGELRDKLRRYYETKTLSLPPAAKQKLKETPSVPSPYSSIFRQKQSLTDEDAADVFMGGR